MSIQTLHSSSASSLQSDLQSSNQKVNKHSRAYTVKKTIAVAGAIFATITFAAGVVSTVVLTAGIAIPVTVPFILGSIGASGMTSTGCFLSHMKFNQSTKNMSKAAHTLKESADGLKGALKDQKDASNLTANMAQSLGNKCRDVNRNQEEITLRLEENGKQIHTEVKKVKETGKELGTQISLLKSLNRRLEKAEATR